MMDDEELQRYALRLRRHILQAIAAASSGHPGGSLSAVEILTLLYYEIMRVRAAEPQWAERDRFVLCKGHAAPALYAVLTSRGFFAESELLTLRQLGSSLQGHPDMRKVPGVDLSTGSLGQGLSAAVGMVLGARYQQLPSHVFALLGDGELQEGQVWEAAMAAGHYHLRGLTAIVDNNGLQIDGSIAAVLNPNPIEAKFAAFGWQVFQAEGHDFASLRAAFAAALAYADGPQVIIAHTVKGKGVSFMENKAEWHGAAPNAEQLAAALAELEAAAALLGGVANA